MIFPHTGPADSIWPLLISVVILALIYWRNGLRDPLFLIALFYFYFSFGPVINWLTGEPVYSGTITNRIFEASVIFTIGLFTWLCVALIIPLRKISADEVAAQEHTPQPMLGIVFLVLVAYALGVLVLTAPALIRVDKIARLAILGSGRHYTFLLLESFAVSTYFTVRSLRALRALYWINFGVYVVYCLFSLERDALLIGFCLLLFSNIVRLSGARRWFGLAMTGIVMIALATIFFIARSTLNITAGLTDVLNQGSLLLINTQVLYLTDHGYPFLYGSSYLNSVLNLLPSWIYHTNFSLLTWFRDVYAMNSSSGYGFALDAEAYLNFGYIGVPVVFAIIAVIQRVMYNRIGRHPFYLYFSVFYTFITMYTLRNDSLALLKGCLYASLFYVAIRFASRIMIGATRPNGVARVTSRGASERPLS